MKVFIASQAQWRQKNPSSASRTGGCTLKFRKSKASPNSVLKIEFRQRPRLNFKGTALSLMAFVIFAAPVHAQQNEPFTLEGEREFQGTLEQQRKKAQTLKNKSLEFQAGQKLKEPAPYDLFARPESQRQQTLGGLPLRGATIDDESAANDRASDRERQNESRFEPRGGDEIPLFGRQNRDRSSLRAMQSRQLEMRTGDPLSRRSVGRDGETSIERRDLDLLEGDSNQPRETDDFEQAFLRAEQDLNQDEEGSEEREGEAALEDEQRAGLTRRNQAQQRGQNNRRRRQQNGQRQDERQRPQTAAERRQLATQENQQDADLNDITGAIRPNAPEDIYAQQGTRMGSFLFFPEITITAHMSDNPTAAPSNGPGDEALELVPRFSLRSDWARHQLEIEGQFTKSYFDELTSENIKSWFLSASGQIDIQNNHFLRLEGRIENAQDDRGDADNLNTDAELTTFETLSLTALYNYQWNRATLQLEGGLTNFDYEDATTLAGLVINNDDQDYLLSTMRARLSYTFNPGHYMYGEGRYSIRDYDSSLDDQGFQRGSEQVAIELGSILDLTSHLRLETALGHHWLYADDVRYADAQQLTYRAALTYQLSEQTTLIARTERTIDGTDLDGTVGVRETDYSLSLTHYFRPNLRLTSSLTFEEEDYIGVSTSQDTLTAEAGLQYILNPNMRILASYAFSDVNTNDGVDYQENIFRLGVTLRP